MMRKWLLAPLTAVAFVSLLLAGAADKSSKTTQKFNLADLANGESRTFGEGDHAITATRRGDEVEMTIPGEKGKNKTLRCTIGKDSCYVMTVGDDGKKQMVMISKTDGSGKDAKEKTITNVVLADGSTEGKNVMVFSSDDGGECCEHLVVQGGDSGMTWVTAGDGTIDLGAGAPGAGHEVKVIRIVGEGGTLLRCPEGDATLVLKKGEENSGPYFCPKHNLKMEPAKGPEIIKETDVQKKSGDSEY